MKTSNSGAFQPNLIPHINYDSYKLQCNSLPDENCNNLPHGDIFSTNTCPSKTLAHEAVLISSIYNTGILRFPIV